MTTSPKTTGKTTGQTASQTAGRTYPYPSPEFALEYSLGDAVRKLTNKDLLGQWSLVYFYPKDDTPGCTTEALDFSALLPDFQAINTHIYGVSADSITKHQNFTKKHSLTVGLISDPDKTLCESFGAIVEKSMYGRKYMGIDRCTFVLDPTGSIVHSWHKVRAKGHAEAVLKKLTEIQAEAS